MKAGRREENLNNLPAFPPSCSNLTTTGNWLIQRAEKALMEGNEGWRRA